MSLLDTAADLREQGPICDSCLGRVFADYSHGLTNAERGRALRIVLALQADAPYEPPDDCWVCEGRCDEFEEWANLAANRLTELTFETYQVGTRVPPLLEENDRLLRSDAELDPELGEALNTELNREVGKRIGQKLGLSVDFERPDVKLLLNLETDRVELTINSAFVYGRYKKLERGLPQTEWPCRDCHGSGGIADDPCQTCSGTGYLYEDSVEELVAPPIREAMEGTDATFHGAGREDVDARMLGTGRPFVVEVHRPRHRFPDVESLTETINHSVGDRVEVRELALATHDMVERVKSLPARKTYRVRITVADEITDSSFQSAISELNGVTVSQETPTRVNHRRAEKTRTRTIYDITGDLTNQSEATVEVTGEGGLYIKELMHGDEGRTRPSLAGLLDTEISVDSLDVLAVTAEEGAFADLEYLRDAPA